MARGLYGPTGGSVLRLASWTVTRRPWSRRPRRGRTPFRCRCRSPAACRSGRTLGRGPVELPRDQDQAVSVGRDRPARGQAREGVAWPLLQRRRDLAVADEVHGDDGADRHEGGPGLVRLAGRFAPLYAQR